MLSLSSDPDWRLVDDILAEYGKEMTWDIKAGLMGKRELPLPGCLPALNQLRKSLHINFIQTSFSRKGCGFALVVILPRYLPYCRGLSEAQR